MEKPLVLEDFRYKAQYSAKIQPLVSEAVDKYLAEASLKEIAKYIPANLDTATNIDLLPFACNAFVANRFNKNDDGADGPTSVGIARHMVYKPVNIEHVRSKVMGVILSYAFTKFGSDEPLTEKQAIASAEPFNVTLGGVLWRVVNPDIAKIVEESSDADSDNYESVSASWEVGFMDYAVATIEGKSKNLADATVITDADQVKKLSPHLRAMKGSGAIDKNTRVYRLLTPGALPLGIGLTENPAADVSGVATQASKTISSSKGEIVVDNAPTTDSAATQIIEMVVTPTYTTITNNQKNQQNISQAVENNVIEGRKVNMSVKITKIEDLTDENLKQVTASEVSQWIKEQIAVADKNFQAEKSSLDTQLKTAKDEHEKLKTSQAEVAEQLKKVNASLEEYKQKEIAREKQNEFNSRMAGLDADFNLNDQERQVIASEVADLDAEGYKKYQTKLNVLLASKKKTTPVAAPIVAAAAPATQPVVAAVPQIAVASVTTDEKKDAVISAISNADRAPVTIPNTSPASENTMDKYAKAFGVDQWISDVKLTD